MNKIARIKLLKTKKKQTEQFINTLSLTYL